MTLHPAAARSSTKSPIARAMARRAHVKAANDNGIQLATDQSQEPAVFTAALRYFGEHGLGAARAARNKAEAAFFAGDRAGYDWWLEICHTLDRRMAMQAAKSIANAGAAAPRA